MATLTAAKPDLAPFIAEVRARASAQYESPQYQRILSLRIGDGNIRGRAALGERGDRGQYQK